MFIPWPSIENFHTLRRTLKDFPDPLQGQTKVAYKAKVKLHGSNAGIRLCPDGQVIPLSRTTVLTPGKADNAGFARWVSETHWLSLCHWGRELVVYGEWCGPKIQQGMALNQIPERIFAVFAILDITHGGEGSLIVEPSEIAKIVVGIPQTHILPWYFSDEAFEATGQIYEIDWSMTAAELEVVLEPINAQVLQVEACDPWVAKVFGIRGMGEGLVFFPQSHPNFAQLAFKAKGKEHRMVTSTKPIQPNPEVASQAPAFAELVVTPARLEQGARAVANGELVFSIKTLGPFLQWMTADLGKETKAELEVSGLSPKVAIAACIAKAKAWYMGQIEAT